MGSNRREFIAGTGATLAALSGLAACAKREASRSAPQTRSPAVADEMLADYPENATSLGIDTGAARGAQGEADRPLGGGAAGHREARRRAPGAASRPWMRATLDEAARIDLDVVRTAHETAAEGFAFPYGDVALLNQNWSWRNAPYVVAQNTGAFLEIPSLLEEQHTVATREDADAYLARLSAYAGQLDGETERLKAAGAQGVIAPDFILDKTLAQIKLARGGNVADWPLVASFAKKTKDLARRLRRRRPRRSPPTRSARRSSASSPSSRRTASRRLRTPASGSCRRAMPTTPGRSAPRPRRA